MPVVEGVRSKETVENVAAYHTLSTEVGKIATEADVGCLVLSHFVPPACDRQALLDEVARDFQGPLIVGEDLMTLDSTAGSLTYNGMVMALGLGAVRTDP